MTPKGLACLGAVDGEILRPMDELLHPNSEAQVKDTLIRVSFDGENFLLSNDAGYEKESAITETEDVSYVASPFLPQVTLLIGHMNAPHLYQNALANLCAQNSYVLSAVPSGKLRASAANDF